MAIRKTVNRFPVSSDLIGPWAELLKLLKEQGNLRGVTSLDVAVSRASQQAILLNNMLNEIQGLMQTDLTALLALEERVAALEGGSVATQDFTIMSEAPLGTKDGSNALFFLSASPSLFLLTLNGQLLVGGGNDYTLSANSFVYVSGKIPASTDFHWAFGLV